MPDSASHRFVLCVDELGSYLVVAASELVIGHQSGADVELPFLADVGTRHALLSRELSFRGGLSWKIAPIGKNTVEVAGTVVGADGHALRHGEQVELGVNLSFRYSQPDPASTTALLELLDDAECLGHRSIVLLGQGQPGQLRLGASAHCHLRRAELDGELRLSHEADRIWIAGAESLSGTSGRDRLEDPNWRPSLALPVIARVDLLLAQTCADGRALGVAITPL